MTRTSIILLGILLSPIFFFAQLSRSSTARTPLQGQEQPRAEDTLPATIPLEGSQYTTLQERLAYEEEMERQLDILEEEIEELGRRDLDLARSDQLALLREIREGLEEMLDAARDELSQLQSLDRGAWLAKKAELDQAFIDLQGAFTEARVTLGLT